MEVQWSGERNETYIKEKIDNQTFYMSFQEERLSIDTIFINVYMTLYNKRIHTDRNENLILTTGNNPIKTVLLARKAFNLLEEDALATYSNDNIIIACTWLDGRRRDAYYKFLSKKGYFYSKLPGNNQKCIMKKFKKGEYNYGNR